MNEKTPLKSDESTIHVPQEPIKRHFYYVAIPVSLALLIIAMYQHTAVIPAHHHDHTVPTLLSIRSNDPNATGKFLNSLDNTLYNIMKIAEFDNDNDNEAVQYQLTADKSQISFHESITLHWEIQNNGIGDVGDGNKYGDMIIENSDDDVIALYCPADEPDPKKFRDAATIGQIRTTNQYNNYNLLSRALSRTSSKRGKRGVGFRKTRNLIEITKSQWTIPSFPIIKEETCAFKFWARGHNDYHADERGKQISTFVLGAVTGPIQIINGRAEPTNIHLALTNNPSEMSVQFATGAEGTPIVVYHRDEDLVTNGSLSSGVYIAQGESTTYKAKDMCQKPATTEEPGKFSSPGMLHSVVMTDLEPNTKYYYKVGIENNRTITDINNTLPDNIVWSITNSFKSAIPTSTQEQFSFIVYGDQGAMGYGNDDGAVRVSQMTEREIEANDIRLVHHIGDLSYAQGVSHMWDKWLDMVSIFSSKVPLMIGIGNHEYDHTDGGENGRDPSGVKTAYGFSPHWGDFGTDSNGECGVPVSKRYVHKH